MEIGFVGLSTCCIFVSIGGGLRLWLLEMSGKCLVCVLHSFLSMAIRPIYLILARDIGGRGCVGMGDFA